jgi:hypothetical protein
MYRVHVHSVRRSNGSLIVQNGIGYQALYKAPYQKLKTNCKRLPVKNSIPITNDCRNGWSYLGSRLPTVCCRKRSEGSMMVSGLGENSYQSSTFSGEREGEVRTNPFRPQTGISSHSWSARPDSRDTRPSTANLSRPSTASPSKRNQSIGMVVPDGRQSASPGPYHRQRSLEEHERVGTPLYPQVATEFLKPQTTQTTDGYDARRLNAGSTAPAPAFIVAFHDISAQDARLIGMVVRADRAGIVHSRPLCGERQQSCIPTLRTR